MKARGQSTVEYALVIAGFLALLAGLFVLFRFVAQGRLALLVTNSLTHRLPWGLIDTGLF